MSIKTTAFPFLHSDVIVFCTISIAYDGCSGVKDSKILKNCYAMVNCLHSYESHTRVSWFSSIQMSDTLMSHKYLSHQFLLQWRNKFWCLSYWSRGKLGDCSERNSISSYHRFTVRVRKIELHFQYSFDRPHQLPQDWQRPKPTHFHHCHG